MGLGLLWAYVHDNSDKRVGYVVSNDSKLYFVLHRGNAWVVTHKGENRPTVVPNLFLAMSSIFNGQSNKLAFQLDADTLYPHRFTGATEDDISVIKTTDNDNDISLKEWVWGNIDGKGYVVISADVKNCRVCAEIMPETLVLENRRNKYFNIVGTDGKIAMKDKEIRGDRTGLHPYLNGTDIKGRIPVVTADGKPVLDKTDNKERIPVVASDNETMLNEVDNKNIVRNPEDFESEFNKQYGVFGRYKYSVALMDRLLHKHKSFKGIQINDDLSDSLYELGYEALKFFYKPNKTQVSYRKAAFCDMFSSYNYDAFLDSWLKLSNENERKAYCSKYLDNFVRSLKNNCYVDNLYTASDFNGKITGYSLPRNTVKYMKDLPEGSRTSNLPYLIGDVCNSYRGSYKFKEVLSDLKHFCKDFTPFERARVWLDLYDANNEVNDEYAKEVRSKWPDSRLSEFKDVSCIKRLLDNMNRTVSARKCKYVKYIDTNGKLRTKPNGGNSYIFEDSDAYKNFSAKSIEFFLKPVLNTISTNHFGFALREEIEELIKDTDYLKSLLKNTLLIMGAGNATSVKIIAGYDYMSKYCVDKNGYPTYRLALNILDALENDEDLSAESVLVDVIGVYLITSCYYSDTDNVYAIICDYSFYYYVRRVQRKNSKKVSMSADEIYDKLFDIINKEQNPEVMITPFVSQTFADALALNEADLSKWVRAQHYNRIIDFLNTFNKVCVINYCLAIIKYQLALSGIKTSHKQCMSVFDELVTNYGAHSVFKLCVAIRFALCAVDTGFVPYKIPTRPNTAMCKLIRLLQNADNDVYSSVIRKPTSQEVQVAVQMLTNCSTKTSKLTKTFASCVLKKLNK